MGSADDTGTYGGSWIARLLVDDGVKLRFQLLFFLNFIAISGFVTFRNVYFEEIGLTGTEMGVIGFLLLATGVAVQPVWGLLTDYLGYQRRVIVLGGIASAIGLLAYPVAASLPEPFALLVVATVVYSAFRAPITPIATEMVLSRGYEYGQIRAFGSLAFAVGSLGFGVVVSYLGSVSVVYFYVVGVVAIVGITASLPATADTGDDDDDQPPIREAASALVTNRNFLVVLLASFLLRLSAVGGEAFFSVYMRTVEVGLALGPLVVAPDGMTGLAWGINSGVEAIAFVYALRGNHSYKRLLVVGGVLLVLPNLVYGLTTIPWVLLAIQALGGIGFAVTSVATVDLAADIAADRVSNTAQTLLAGIGYSLGGAVGQVAAGVLLDAVGIRQMYVAIALLGFLGAFVGLLVAGDTRSPSVEV